MNYSGLLLIITCVCGDDMLRLVFVCSELYVESSDLVIDEILTNQQNLLWLEGI